MKKRSDLSRLMEYAGGHRVFTYVSWVLSALSALVALVPFLYIWMILRDVLNAAPDYSRAVNIPHYGWMAVLFAALSYLIYVCALLCSHLSAFRVATNLRLALSEHLARLPLGFTERYGSGKLRKVIQESTGAAETYLAHQLPDQYAAMATPVGLLVLLFVFDWRLGLLSLVPVALGFVIMSAMTGKCMAEKMRQYGNALAAMSGEAVEYVRGIPFLKTFGQSVFSFKKFKATIDEYEKWVIAYTKELRMPMLFYTAAINGVFAFLIAGGLLLTRNGVTPEFLLNLLIESIRDLKASNAEQGYLGGLSRKIRAVEKQTIAAELTNAVFVTSAGTVLKLGIASVALTGSVLLSGRIDVLTLFLFLLVASRLYDPMQGALQNLAAVIAMRTNVARMNEILEYPIQTGSEQLSNQVCDIVFDHVGFAYNSGETVLKDVSFTAKQGQVTALVGPSGGGKTTVSRLAARFWDYQKGSITVGGMDVSKIDPEKLMSLYSIVFQDVTLFDNTILENIRLGRKDATDEEVLAAAKLANCDEFAEKLPDKWNTDIGENGCALSGGERQRISIARAFLKDAPIILLDEATASLDVENETLIQTALSRLIRSKTVLIIAHRMRTVAGVDKIVVLADGVVAEQGSPNELYAKNGLYTHMVDLQNGSQNWSL
ncbi:ABC transporter ATP-binding protein [Faecousia sp.]|uniref:ABC transporter ATP-binding protein n=1 Tax=Faecousia sp. TaxID=2952921 RepID=UPI002A9349B9|nr:ABC transporter ATP-binding protein [Candidatus Faecousia sp.]